MNYNTQHPSDEIIDRELQALRQPASSVHGLGDAILAMKATPKAKRPTLGTWMLRLSPLAIAAGAFLAFSLSPAKAYAQELGEIADAQHHRMAKFQKSYIFAGESQPLGISELYLEGDRECFREFSPDGTLQSMNVRDGHRVYRYYIGSPKEGVRTSASIEEDSGGELSITTLDSMLTSDFFSKRKIVKQSGVKLNGMTCDYYDFANGYYRLWINPKTKLPIQREVWDRGKTLWERDVYEYPVSFPNTTFEAKVPGVTFFDYPSTRTRLESKIADGGQVKSVGGVSICLKALIRDPQGILAIFTTTGGKGNPMDRRLMKMEGTQYAAYFQEVSTLRVSGADKLLGVMAVGPMNQTTSKMIEVGAWDAQNHYVGSVSFSTEEAFEAPFAGTLARRPIAGPPLKAISVAKSKG